MRYRSIFVIALLGLAGCTQEDAGTDFSLTGTVVEARAGVEPEGIPDADSGTDVDPGTGAERDEGGPEEPGAFVVRPEDDTNADLGDCSAPDEGYTVFYREDTTFDPSNVTSDDDFPESLEGSDVQINGTFYASTDEGDDDECALVAERVTVTGEDPRTPPPLRDATLTPGPRPTGPEATPAKTDQPDEGTAEPEATATG